MKKTQLGLLTGFLAYAIWGFFPLFFALFRDLASLEVLTHRVIWSFVFVTCIIVVSGRKKHLLEALRSPKLLKGLLLSSTLVSTNWLIFIWAVAQGRVLESSLGYFITPLVSVFLARAILKEHLDPWRQSAIFLAMAGLLWFLFMIGYLPWVSLALAITFGLYGLVRKQLEVDTLTGLSVETAIMLPLALLYWSYLAQQGQSHLVLPPDGMTLLLMISGVLTALPLLLFASAAKKLTLSTLGFMMYINPSLQFFSAIYILGEAFDQQQFIGFCFIWCALLLFIIGSLRRTEKESWQQLR